MNLVRLEAGVEAIKLSEPQKSLSFSLQAEFTGSQFKVLKLYKMDRFS